MSDRTTSRRDLSTVFGLLCFSLLLSRLLSRHRIMWSDELFGWMLVTDPTFAHMLQAWNAGADGGGVFFYLLARLWLALFGHTVAAFRLFSAAGVAIAAAFTFRIARRWFAWPVAIVSVSVVWFSSDIVLWQLIQSRFYGMLLATVAAAVYLFVRAEVPVTPGMLVTTSLCHTLLVGSHPFGLVYSAAILFAMCALDVLARRRRLRLYLAVLTGWWVLLPSLEALRNSAAVARPHFWTTTPILAELGNTYACWSLPTAVLLGSLPAALLVLRLLRRAPIFAPSTDVSGKRPLAIVCGSLLLVPLFVFAVSQRGNSIFVDRYLVPVVIPVAILLCQSLSSLSDDLRRAPLPQATVRLLGASSGAVLLGATLWIAAVQFPAYWIFPSVDTSHPLLALLPRGVPIVVEPVDLFDQLISYHRQEGYNFVYLLDWENVTDPASPRGEVSGYHEMENWKAVGYFSGSILDSGRFLAHTRVFAVVDDPKAHLFERRVRTDPTFLIESLGTVHRDRNPANDRKVWLVRSRLPPSQTGVAAHPELTPRKIGERSAGGGSPLEAPAF